MFQQPLPLRNTRLTPEETAPRIGRENSPVEDAWCDITSVVDEETLIPITYVNSAANLKAFVGFHGGSCCTSSNARKVLEWALQKGSRLLFFPDQHLGRNTAVGMGFDPDRD